MGIKIRGAHLRIGKFLGGHVPPVPPLVSGLGTGYPDESSAAHTRHIKSQVTPWRIQRGGKGIAIPQQFIDSLANSAPADKHFENGEEISS